MTTAVTENPVQVQVVPDGAPIDELAIATTDRCQARCAHCLMKSGPERTEELSLEEMESFISYLHEQHGLQLVVFTGGESTLLGDTLLEAIAFCSERGIGTRLVTNAIWAQDYDTARDYLVTLRECGLNELNISTDDFHLAWIPIDNVLRAWSATKGLGFTSVLVAVCSGPRSRLTPDGLRDLLGEDVPDVYDEQMNRAMPQPQADGTAYAISNTKVSRLGRGRGLRRDYLPEPSSREPGHLAGGCAAMLKPVTMMGDGSVGVCCGVNIEGNEILSLRGAVPAEDGSGGRQYHLTTGPQQALVLDAIRHLGPSYLYSLATGATQEEIEAEYSSICEVCETLTTDRRMLAEIYRHQDKIRLDVEVAKLAHRIVERS
ncbi:radical SAM protein [Actinomyces wuliandei]|uniref:radical SAM protein n=1 Tax=Actinomyces wuliandei TaxID=2057743 RepID=UPI00111A2A6D|nr:radical SAM protein [Actinomyces wuliandei]